MGRAGGVDDLGREARPVLAFVCVFLYLGQTMRYSSRG